MIVRLIAKPLFLGLPPELGTPREDQLRGPDAMKLIETAARTCYDSFGTGRNSEDHARHILEVDHGSVLEHAQFSFFLGGSRGWSHEHVRHRVGIAISQRSTRYCDESDSEWIMHPLLRAFLAEAEHADPTENSVDEAWHASVATAREAYKTIVNALQGWLISKGIDKLTARKQARGAARGVLGNALATEMVWSANVRLLRHFLDMRASQAADAEIREIAVEILCVMKNELPIYFDDYRIVASPDGIGEIASRVSLRSKAT